MRLHFLVSICTVVITLSGCGAVQHAQMNAASQKAQQEIGGKCYFYLHVPAAEAAAWANTVDRMAQCGAGYAEPPRDKMLGISECGAKAMNELIRPNMHSKKRFDDYMEARKSEHEEYRE